MTAREPARSVPSTIFRTAWAVLIVAFVVVGGRETFPALREGEFYRPAPYASTDAYLEGLTGTRGGSELILQTLDKIPADRPLVYFCPKGDGRWDFVFGLMSYLSWPRDIRKVEVPAGALGEKLAATDHAAAGALIFCALQPPAGFTRGWRIGSQILIVPTPEPQ